MPQNMSSRDGSIDLTDFSRLWLVGYQTEQEAWLQRWAEARESWLQAIYSQRSRSAATRRAYNHGLDRFYQWAGVDPWLVTERRREAYRQELIERGIGPNHYRLPWTISGDDGARYISHLTEQGLAPATVSTYVAICSSFYDHVIHQTLTIGGMEISLFPDAAGRTRANPWRNGLISRPIVSAYSKAQALTVEQIQRIRFSIRPDTLRGARDLAIFLTLLYTGRRVGELVQMRWGDIEGAPGARVWRWRGKGGRSGVQALPETVYQALEAYLRRQERWPLRHDEFVWRPMTDRSTRNVYAGDLQAVRPISPGRIRQILKRLARQADLPQEKIHPHVLRHTFADLYQRTTGDLAELSRILGHRSLSTTGIYLDSLRRPVDQYSSAFADALGF